MPVPAKVLHALALTGREEATYGTAVALTPATDGLQMQFAQGNTAAVFQLNYVYDGDLGPSITSLGTIQRVVPTGFWAGATIPTLVRCPAVLYSATTVPNVHRLIKAAGFTATGAFGVGTENWAYTPTVAGTTYTSLTLNAYERGEMLSVTGALADLIVDGKDAKPPVWSFPIKGIAAYPTDASPIIPAGLAYPNSTVLPAVNQNTLFVMGSLNTAAVVKSWTFKMGRKFDNQRLGVTGTNIHQGFVPAQRVPMLTVVVEATALVGTPFTSAAGFDPYQLKGAAQAIGAVSVQVNSAVQYNRYKIALNQAQLVNYSRTGEGPTATVTLDFVPYNTGPVSDGTDLTITFD